MASRWRRCVREWRVCCPCCFGSPSSRRDGRSLMDRATISEQSAVSREILFPLFDWLGHSVVGQTIRSSAVLIALTQIIHLLGLTLLAGTVLMVDMALFGFGIRRVPTSRIAAELAPWTAGGLVVMLISGPLILSSETRKCYD